MEAIALPALIYEGLPAIYTASSLAVVSMNESGIRYFPATVLFMAAMMVWAMRYSSRHGDTR